MGLTWALAWFGAGMVLLLIVGPDAADVPFPLGFGLLGFLAGVTFSGVVATVAGRRTFDEMSIPRFAFWGGLGGLLFGVLFVFTASTLGAASLSLPGMGAIFALAGAGSAAASLAVARWGQRGDSLGAGADVDEVASTGDEARQLPGGGG